MRRQTRENPTLDQRLANERDVEVLQVAQAAVDHLRGAAAGAAGEVVAFDQGDVVAAAGRVERDAGAGHSAADHEDVELLAVESS